MANKCNIRLSIFPGWPQFVHFISPEEEYESTVDLGWFFWNLPSASSPLVIEAIRRARCSIKEENSREWLEKRGPVWDHLLVSEKSNPLDFSGLHPSVKINKFPGSSTLCRKDKLWTNFDWLRKKFGTKVFAFLPKANQ